MNSHHSRLYKTVKDKGYVKLSQKRLVPTENGIRLCDFLTAHFADVLAYSYTAQLEAKLDGIAIGDATRLDVLNVFWDGFQPQVIRATEAALSQLKGHAAPKPLMLHPAQE